jgi:hypothetical protein
VSPRSITRAASSFDGFERNQAISTQTLMDHLEVPQRQRRAGTYLHLATLAELGWTAVRVRDLTRGAQGANARVRSQRERVNSKAGGE